MPRALQQITPVYTHEIGHTKPGSRCPCYELRAWPDLSPSVSVVTKGTKTCRRRESASSSPYTRPENQVIGGSWTQKVHVHCAQSGRSRLSHEKHRSS